MRFKIWSPSPSFRVQGLGFRWEQFSLNKKKHQNLVARKDSLPSGPKHSITGYLSKGLGLRVGV